MKFLVFIATFLVTQTALAGQGEGDWSPWEAPHNDWSCSLKTGYETFDDDYSISENLARSVSVIFGRMLDKAGFEEANVSDTIWNEFQNRSVEEGELVLLLGVSTVALVEGPFAPISGISINGLESDFVIQFPDGGGRYFVFREPLSKKLLTSISEGNAWEFVANLENDEPFTFGYSEGTTVRFKVALAQFEACVNVLSHNKSLNSDAGDAGAG